ncbi:unnamed protein product [Amoebophrya sp. A120]|nr:unnamed protein product [Amoebophrya sp. A120]|eukprot:GSA120T00023023001.1
MSENEVSSNHRTTSSNPKKTRLSLVERQQQLLEEKGFSKPSKAVTATSTASSKNSDADHGAGAARRGGLLSRADETLIRRGRGNATSASRKAIQPEEPDGAELQGASGDDRPGGATGGATQQQDDTASVATTRRSTWSAAPSLHPSVAASGKAFSLACSETTIGAGDETMYWDYQHRLAQRSDLGHMCRECRKPFTQVGEPITERRGSRISTRYHAECFSGYADPRSQARSSTHEGRLAGTQFEAAPDGPFSKMRTQSHFSGGTTGKSVGAQMAMGRLSFARSSRGVDTTSGLMQQEGDLQHQNLRASSSRVTGGDGTGSDLTADRLALLDSEQHAMRGGGKLKVTLEDMLGIFCTKQQEFRSEDSEHARKDHRGNSTRARLRRP